MSEAIEKGKRLRAWLNARIAAMKRSGWEPIKQAWYCDKCGELLEVELLDDDGRCLCGAKPVFLPVDEVAG